MSSGRAFGISAFFYIHMPYQLYMKNCFQIISACLLIVSCTMKDTKQMGSIERIDASLNEIINENAKVEILAEGYTWSEGPIWIESQKMLLFSDVPENTIFKWTESNGAEPYLAPSGYTGSTPFNGPEPGSNGLTLDGQGRLVLCQHGDRRIARMDATIEHPKSAFVSLADTFQGKKLNSPNDLVFRSNGDLFFTDPPYGLPTQQVDDPLKEIPFQGVYKLTPEGKLTVLVDSLTRPNGLAFTPDEKTLIVANSDPEKVVWYAFDLTYGDSVANPRIFYDATLEKGIGKGLPDGLKIDKRGNIFATGPGGIWVFNKAGKVIGRIKLPQAAANCAFADDEKTLYITSHMYLLRIKLR